jgi:hypothetical protein
LIPADEVEHRVSIGDECIPIPPTAIPADFAGVPAPPVPGLASFAAEPVRELPLGAICGARSGDKGGNANVGVWVRTPEAYAWLEGFLTEQRLRRLLPELRDLEVARYAFPKLRALNFVAKGLLGDGVAASLRSDPQAKTLGEYLRAKRVPIPEALLPDD